VNSGGFCLHGTSVVNKGSGFPWSRDIFSKSQRSQGFSELRSLHS
jgi:hypothetical protein